MEISLSPELMALFEKLIGVFTRVQFQYLIVIIPTAIIALVMLVIYAKPLWNTAIRWWLIRRMTRQGTAIITMIHSQPTSLIGLFKLPFISLDDSLKVIKALREIPKEKQVNLILHTPGGLVIAAEQMARAIKARGGNVHAYIPQYAMSGGTLVALACDSIHLGKNAVLGPLDPQLSIGLFEVYPAASILASVKQKNANRDDKTLILADIAQKALCQLKQTTSEILKDKYGDKSDELADQLCSGNWTHDFGIDTYRAKTLGLKVDNDIPNEIERLVEFYPTQSSVSYKKGARKHNNNDGRITIHL